MAKNSFEKDVFMKYRILIALACVLLAAAILLNLPSEPRVEPGPETQSTLPTLGQLTQAPSEPAMGAVRLYCCDSDWLPVLTELAAQYTELSGIEVTVLNPGAEGCQDTLSTLLESEAPPTVFCIHTENQLANRRETLLDLADTAFAAQLIDPDFGWYQDGALLAVPVDLEAFGLLFNAELLATKAALSRGDIQDLASLATASQILKNNSVKAFSAAEWSQTAALRLLNTSDPERVREFLDLYLANSSTSGDTLALFLEGKTVFYLGSTADYSTIEAESNRTLELRNLDILPTYSNGTMQYFCQTAWGVNANVQRADLEETLTFLLWMVTAADNAAPIDSLQILTAFVDAAWYDDQLEKKVRGYMQSEPVTLAFAPNLKNQITLLEALKNYMADPGDDSWNLLKGLLQ